MAAWATRSMLNAPCCMHHAACAQFSAVAVAGANMCVLVSRGWSNVEMSTMANGFNCPPDVMPALHHGRSSNSESRAQSPGSRARSPPQSQWQSQKGANLHLH